jgi:hypothetical protein
MLHQDITQEPVSQYSRILFVEPGTSSSFNNLTFHTPVGNALTIDVKLFCEDMVSAVETWLPKLASFRKLQRICPNQRPVTRLDFDRSSLEFL